MTTRDNQLLATLATARYFAPALHSAVEDAQFHAAEGKIMSELAQAKKHIAIAAAHLQAAHDIKLAKIIEQVNKQNPNHE